jgi:hypothetical protein
MPFLTVETFGGIQNWKAPHLNDPQTAADLLDADTSRGDLRPARDRVSAPEPSNPRWTQNRKGDRSIARFADETYWTDNVAGTISSTLGYVGVQPINVDTATSTPFSITPRIKGTRFRGVYKYVITYETADGWESGAYPIENVGDSPAIGSALSETDDEVDAIDLEADAWSATHIGSRPQGNVVYGYAAGSVVNHLGRTWKSLSYVNKYGSSPAWYSFGASGTMGNNVAPSTDGGKYWEDITGTAIETVGYQILDLDHIPQPSQSAVRYINLYRTVGDGAIFYLAHQLSVGTLTVEDQLDDPSLVLGRQIDLSRFIFPPVYRKKSNGIYALQETRYLTEFNEVFYVASGSRVYVSEQSNPHSYDPNRFFELQEPVTGMTKGDKGILAFTANRTFELVGSDFASAVLNELSVKQGCPNWRTISSLRNQPVWQSYDGLCAYAPFSGREGRNIEVLTEGGYRFEGQGRFAEVANDAYYLFYTDHAVVIDFRHDRIYRLSTRADNAYYDEDTDRLLVYDVSAAYELGQGDDRTWTMTTQEFAPGGTTRLKEFLRIRIDSDADVEITSVKVDGKETRTRPFPVTDNCFVPLPRSEPGYRLQLTLKGKGILRQVTVEFTTIEGDV